MLSSDVRDDLRVELLTAITHVATQLTGRWFPLPKITEASLREPLNQRIIDQYSEGGLPELDQTSWVDLLEFDTSCFIPSLHWLEGALRARKIGISILAETATRHFQSTAAGLGTTVSIHSPIYPPLLRQISRPPLCLSILGNPKILASESVAVIGSRKGSYESLRASIELGMVFAETSPWSIVSGGAIGCDIAVHEGMLASRMDSISAAIVFAGGLHNRFPQCNARAFHAVVERGGVLVSERLWFQDVLPRDFASRNRIVSGMCGATAVMAAAPRSGSLITAHEALEQGRDVYVFDTGDDDARLEGSRQLISDGALPFSSPHELLEYLCECYDSDNEYYGGFLDNPCQVTDNFGIIDSEYQIN
jgi:DNA protecting protein DprA